MAGEPARGARGGGAGRVGGDGGRGDAVREALAGLGGSASAAAALSMLAVGDRRRVRWPSAGPAGLFGEYVHGLGPDVSASDAVAGAAAGRGVAGLLAVDVLSRPGVAGREAEEVFENGVAEPWLDGSARARAELLDVLAEVDPAVPDLLEGAWADVERQGPAAGVKISTCAVEALERTLRALAPGADVLAWHAAARRPSDELHNGRPTHSLRARSVLRDGKRGRLAAAQVYAIAVQVSDLRSALQAGKHASAGQVAALRAHLLSVEAVLHQLVAGR